MTHDTTLANLEPENYKRNSLLEPSWSSTAEFIAKI